MIVVMLRRRGIYFIVIAGMVAPQLVLAVPSTSPNYRLDPEVANTFGGTGSSANYILTDSGGETAVGSASSSTSYKIGVGYVAELVQSIQMSLSAGSTTIPDVTAGTSQVANLNATVSTDAPAYSLGISQDHNLRHTDTITTIPSSSGSIAVPALWTEATTTGLGFTVTAGTNLEASWGTSPNFKFAAIPSSTTTFHTHTGLLGGASDGTTIRYRLDVPSSQKGGAYTNVVTYTATTIP